MIRRIISFLLAAFFTLFILWGAGYLWFTLSVYTMKPALTDKTAEAIIVLTGGENRVKTGINLLEETPSKKLFISGVNPKTTKQDILKMWREDPRSPPCCITLGREAKNTQENAIETKEWIKKNDIKSIRLVTSAYHMPRSLLEFEKNETDLVIFPHPVHSRDISPRHKKFWALTFSEYNKTLLTWLRLRSAEKEAVS